MKVRPVEAKLFRADGRTDGRVDRYVTTNSRSSEVSECA
jgi:hypothetical protein